VRSYFLFAALRRAAQYAFMRSLWRFLAAAVSFRFFRATVAAFLLLPGGRPLRGAVPWSMAIARSNRSRSAIRSFRGSIIAFRAYQAGRGIRNKAWMHRMDQPLPTRADLAQGSHFSRLDQLLPCSNANARADLVGGPKNDVVSSFQVAEDFDEVAFPHAPADSDPLRFAVRYTDHEDALGRRLDC